MKRIGEFIRSLIPNQTSKRAMGGVLLFCGGAAIAVLVGWFKGLPDVAVLLGIIATPATTVLSWYYAKASRENVIKIAKAAQLTQAQTADLLKGSGSSGDANG